MCLSEDEVKTVVDSSVGLDLQHVVKVERLPDPVVVGQLAVSLAADVPQVLTITVVELPFKHLQYLGHMGTEKESYFEFTIIVISSSGVCALVLVPLWG